MKKIVIALVAILIIQSCLYVYVGTKKHYIHIDEAYSLGLTHYDKIDIQDNEDFFNNWHARKYYEEYLSVQDGEDYMAVYENQKNDVHPPFYYLLLRFAMEITKGHFSKWSGIGLNIIIYCFMTVFMYMILSKLMENEEKKSIKAIVLAFLSSIILASVSNVINIRMYSLATLNVSIITLLHIKLTEPSGLRPKLLIITGISVLTGFLTHYYYIIYLAGLYLIFFIKYIKEKKYKNLCYYTMTIIGALTMSLIIFPYSINHIFSGYRGQGAISNFGNISGFVPSILEQLHNLNYYGFNNIMVIIIIAIIGISIFNRIYKKQIIRISAKEKEILKIIYIPSLIFFIITSITSPWRVLRYIVPICSLTFVATIYYLYKLLQTACKVKIADIIISILCCIVIIAPFMLKMKPELLFDDRKEIMQSLQKELNLPAIYLYNSKNEVLLDDIFPFSVLDQTYIAKDSSNPETEVKQILENKDISKGILLFINYDINNTTINSIKKSLNLSESKFLQRLSSCDLYYMY